MSKFSVRFLSKFLGFLVFERKCQKWFLPGWIYQVLPLLKFDTFLLDVQNIIELFVFCFSFTTVTEQNRIICKSDSWFFLF